MYVAYTILTAAAYCVADCQSPSERYSQSKWREFDKDGVATLALPLAISLQDSSLVHILPRSRKDKR